MDANGFCFQWLFATKFVLGGEIGFGVVGFMGVEGRSQVGDVCSGVFIGVYFGCSVYIQHLCSL